MEIRRCQTQVGDQAIGYNHYYSDSNEVCFMLSGAGYAYDHPYFYFSRMMLLKRGVNVIEVQYVSDDLFSLPDEQGDVEMSRRIEAVIDEVLRARTYQTIHFIAKSLGTVPLVSFIRRGLFPDATIVLLTPLLKDPAIVEAIANSRHHGLLVIGDHDHQFSPEALERCGSSNLVLEQIKGANHSLDIDFEVNPSLQVLGQIMQRTEEVLFPVSVKEN
ncbi:cyclase [Exiguobacterium sp. RIT452]|uniref:cyclase n=1 Tax=Exiguobacterium sp. RIT452 TaxID=2315552 RepID=UPI000E707F0F|nr:cyclase [Exiguobacterium sp. RIT452]RJO96881.1 cyclase [Exiguobacterium sp. RIT452]